MNIFLAGAFLGELWKDMVEMNSRSDMGDIEITEFWVKKFFEKRFK